MLGGAVNLFDLEVVVSEILLQSFYSCVESALQLLLLVILEKKCTGKKAHRKQAHRKKAHRKKAHAEKKRTRKKRIKKKSAVEEKRRYNYINRS